MSRVCDQGHEFVTSWWWLWYPVQASWRLCLTDPGAGFLTLWSPGPDWKLERIPARRPPCGHNPDHTHTYLGWRQTWKLCPLVSKKGNSRLAAWRPPHSYHQKGVRRGSRGRRRSSRLTSIRQLNLTIYSNKAYKDPSRCVASTWFAATAVGTLDLFSSTLLVCLPVTRKLLLHLVSTTISFSTAALFRLVCTTHIHSQDT